MYYSRFAWVLSILSALASTRCSTTTQASRATPAANTWLEEHESSDATVALANGSEVGEMPTVLSREVPSIEPPAPQATPIQIISISDGRAISLEDVQEIKVVKRPRGAAEGTLIGVGIGILSGVVFGLAAGDSPNRDDCGYPCTRDDKMKAAGVVLGAIGAALGAIVGAAIGHRDILSF